MSPAAQLSACCLIKRRHVDFLPCWASTSSGRRSGLISGHQLCAQWSVDHDYDLLPISARARGSKKLLRRQLLPGLEENFSWTGSWRDSEEIPISGPLLGPIQPSKPARTEKKRELPASPSWRVPINSGLPFEMLDVPVEEVGIISLRASSTGLDMFKSFKLNGASRLVPSQLSTRTRSVGWELVRTWNLENARNWSNLSTFAAKKATSTKWRNVEASLMKLLNNKSDDKTRQDSPHWRLPWGSSIKQLVQLLEPLFYLLQVFF